MTGNVMPVGFNIENNSIEIIYLTKNIYNSREWGIEYYKNAGKITNGLNAKL
jgi:hypothetical protein